MFPESIHVFYEEESELLQCVDNSSLVHPHLPMYRWNVHLVVRSR